MLWNAMKFENIIREILHSAIKLMIIFVQKLTDNEINETAQEFWPYEHFTG